MIATRFAVAVHILLLLAAAVDRAPITSARLALSLRTNPVVARRITGQLARAGLVRIRRGPGGAGLARPPATITLAAVWAAVNADDTRPMLRLHAGADNSDAQRVQVVLTESFAAAEAAFRRALDRVTLADLAGRMQHAPEAAIA